MFWQQKQIRKNTPEKICVVLKVAGKGWLKMFHVHYLGIFSSIGGDSSIEIHNNLITLKSTQNFNIYISKIFGENSQIFMYLFSAPQREKS